MVKGIMDYKGEKTIEVKKGAVLITEAEMAEIYFSRKKLITFCGVMWNRDNLICAKDLCKLCAHTQVSERIVSDLQSLEHLKAAFTDKSFILFSQKLMIGV